MGPLRSAFVANPTARGPADGGVRPTPARTSPSTIHPGWRCGVKRRCQAPPTPIPLNCLVFGSDSSKMDCVTLDQATPTNPWSTCRPFSCAGSSSPANRNPARDRSAKWRWKASSSGCRARVYRYSLAPMAGQVHVHFYGVPWNQSNRPAGNAFLIGEDSARSDSALRCLRSPCAQLGAGQRDLGYDQSRESILHLLRPRLDTEHRWLVGAGDARPRAQRPARHADLL